jgi:predicted Zn-dependent protease
VGDISQLLAAAPAAARQARYSRALETEADEYGAALLMRNGLSPALLADALEKLVQVTHLESRSAVTGYVASHPPTDERMARLRAMAKAARSP